MSGETDKSKNSSKETEQLVDELTFDPDKSDIDPRLRLRTDFADALKGTDFSNCVILPLDVVHELSKEPYPEIIMHIAEEEPESVSELADDLDRDQGNMTKYLNKLMKYDIVKLEKNGRKKKAVIKHSHVVPEPLF